MNKGKEATRTLNTKPRTSSFIDSIITDIEKANVFNLVSKSFKSWYRNWPWIILNIFIDIIFLISVSAVITLIQFTLFEHLEALMSMTGEATGGLMGIYNQTAEVSSSLVGLGSNLDFQYHLNIIFKYLGFMILAVFVLWILLQGISWYIAYRMSTEKRIPFFTFWKNFALQSIPFYLLTILWIFISIKMLFSTKMSIAPIFSEDFANFIFALLIILTWYFGSICYTITSRYAYKNVKHSFIFGIRGFTKTIQSFGFIIFLFLIIDLFLRIPFIREDPFVLAIIGTLIFMPALIFAKILLFNTTREYLTAKKR